MSEAQLYASLIIPQIEIIIVSNGMARNLYRLHARANAINVVNKQVMYSMFFESSKSKILKTF